MKTFKLLVIGTLLLLSAEAKSQVFITAASPPPWGPAGHTGVRYYYLPGVESYYDVDASKFIYNSKGVWVHRSTLPSRYRRYNLYKGHKVVMTDYRGNTPYTYYGEHKQKYSKRYRGGVQKTIGEKPGKGKKKGHSNGEGNKH
jgi:hypothetical protein